MHANPESVSTSCKTTYNVPSHTLCYTHRTQDPLVRFGMCAVIVVAKAVVGPVTVESAAPVAAEIPIVLVVPLVPVVPVVAEDFREAFDNLEWSLLQYALHTFNFGEGIRRWVEIFYNDVKSTIFNNGFSTNWIKPTRGVRQGCPLSPFLFVLSAELMANKIHHSNNDKGVLLFGNEIKLSQFADDTNLICSDLQSVEKALQILGDFGDISGLRLKKRKNTSYVVGFQGR